MPVQNGYLPAKDADLAQWAINFSTLITANFVTYGLTTGQQSTFATLRTSFVSALATATNVSTRTKSTVAAKNAARALMLANARTLASIIQGNPAVTNQMRQDLQLTVRDRSPSPVGPPTSAPIVTPLNTSALKVRFRFADELTPSSRSKPAGVVGLQLYAKVGTTPPVTLADCSFRGAYTVNSTGPGSAAAEVAFSSADVGKTAYLIGVWQNRRGDIGPQSAVSSMTIAA
jgi:hypothetical protein